MKTSSNVTCRAKSQLSLLQTRRHVLPAWRVCLLGAGTAAHLSAVILDKIPSVAPIATRVGNSVFPVVSIHIIWSILYLLCNLLTEE